MALLVGVTASGANVTMQTGGPMNAGSTSGLTQLNDPGSIPPRPALPAGMGIVWMPPMPPTVVGFGGRP